MGLSCRHRPACEDRAGASPGSWPVKAAAKALPRRPRQSPVLAGPARPGSPTARKVPWEGSPERLDRGPESPLRRDAPPGRGQAGLPPAEHWNHNVLNIHTICTACACPPREQRPSCC